MSTSKNFAMARVYKLRSRLAADCYFILFIKFKCRKIIHYHFHFSGRLPNIHPEIFTLTASNKIIIMAKRFVRSGNYFVAKLVKIIQSRGFIIFIAISQCPHRRILELKSILIVLISLPVAN